MSLSDNKTETVIVAQQKMEFHRKSIFSFMDSEKP